MGELTVEQADAIVDELANLDVDGRVYEDYSGRGMNGRTCVAIVVSGYDPIAVGYAAALAEVPFEDVPARTDNLGYDTVVY